jgi:hypothetical protein
VIIVIGHEKLNVEMRREFGDSLAVVKIPKSGGVSLREGLDINVYRTDTRG